MKGGRRQGRLRKRWEDKIREWTGLEFTKSQRAVEKSEKWKKQVAKSSVVPQRPSLLRDRSDEMRYKVKKSDLFQPILPNLHWLQVTHRSQQQQQQQQISVICFSSLSGKSPQYLSDLIQPYSPTRKLRSASDTRTFVIPCVHSKLFGESPFSYAGPSIWNSR